MPTPSVDKKINKLSEKIVKYTNNVGVLREELKQARLALREAKKATHAITGGGVIKNGTTLFKKATTRLKNVITKGIRATTRMKKKDNTTVLPPPEEKKLNEVVVIVFGMGCDALIKKEYNSKTSRGSDLMGIVKYYNEIVGRKTIIFCEQDMKVVIGNIAKLALGIGGPTKDVVDRVYEKIISLANDNTIDRIDIVGHSYGGSIISAVLEKWNAQLKKSITTGKSLDKCHVHTLGSIYIPPPSKTTKLVSQGMTINHYMFSNDVAQRVKMPPNQSNVIWIGNFKKSMTVLGTRLEWEIHSRFVEEFIRYAITQKLKPEEVKEKMTVHVNNKYKKHYKTNL